MANSASPGERAAADGSLLALRLRRWWWIPLTLAVAGALSAVSPWTTVSVLAFSLTFILIVARPLLGLLMFVALQPFLDRVIEIPMGQGLPDLSIGRLAIAFLLIAIVGRAANGKAPLAPVGPMEVCAAAVPLGIMLAAPASKDPLTVVQWAVSFYLLPLLMYVIAKNCVGNERELDLLFGASMMLGVLATAYMIFELTTGNVLLVEENVDPTSVSRMYSASDPSFWQVRGVLASSASFGRVLITTIPASIYLYFRQPVRLRRWGLAAAILFQSLGLYLSLNRSCWFALAVGLGIMQFAYPRLRRWLLVGSTLALVALALFFRPIADSDLVRKRVAYNFETLNGRLPRWQTSLEMWKAKPVLGWGFGRFEDQSGRFRKDGVTLNWDGPESDYLFILVGAGLLGFVPHILSLLLPWLCSLRLFARARAPDWRGFVGPEAIVTFWAVLCGLLLASLTVVQTQAVVRGLVFTIAGGVVGTHERWLRRSTRDARPLGGGDPPGGPVENRGGSADNLRESRDTA